MSLLTIFGVIFNGILFTSIIRNKKSRSNTTMLLISAQALVDFMFCFFTFTMSSISISYTYVPSRVFCDATRLTTATTALVSIYNLALIAGVRYKMVVQEKKVSPKNVVAGIAFTWLLALVLQITLVFGDETLQGLSATMLGCISNSGEVGFVLTGTLVTALGFIIFCYYKVLRKIGKTLIVLDDKTANMQKRINRMLLSSMGVVLSAWFPTSIIYILSNGDPHPLPWLASMLVLVGSAVLNPCLFTYFSKDVKAVVYPSLYMLICKDVPADAPAFHSTRVGGTHTSSTHRNSSRYSKPPSGATPQLNGKRVRSKAFGTSTMKSPSTTTHSQAGKGFKSPASSMSVARSSQVAVSLPGSVSPPNDDNATVVVHLDTHVEEEDDLTPTATATTTPAVAPITVIQV
jgi:hypothetical protein